MRIPKHTPSGTQVARAHGLFNILSGAWPLLHMRSFQVVMGPKVDIWLVQTVAGLLVANGLVQLTSAGTPDGRTAARRIGTGTAATLLTIDLVHVPQRHIRPVYLVDAAAEAAWVLIWRRTSTS